MLTANAVGHHLQHDVITRYAGRSDLPGSLCVTRVIGSSAPIGPALNDWQTNRSLF